MNEGSAKVYVGHLEYSSLMPRPERWVRASDHEALVVVHEAALLANKILVERDAIFTAEITKLKEARVLSAEASATLRDEALGHQRLCLTLANENRALEAALRKAVSRHTGHFPWCAKGGQMPMVIDRQYTHPTDWDAWRATVACTCEVAMLPEVKTAFPASGGTVDG